MLTDVLLLPKFLATLNLGSQEYFSQHNIIFGNKNGYMMAKNDYPSSRGAS
jgi:hypothetical protein